LDDYSSAFWLLNQSLAYAPGNDAAINMMAVVYRRAGDPQKAEEIYRYGIEHLADKVTLLRNYRILLNDQGRFAEADEVATQLERLGEPNPFDWIHAAQQAHSEGQYTEAISLYKKAVAIAPYLHESYFGMARSHYELGNRERAETELAQALERADRASTRSLYEAKLTALTGSPIEE
jgi:Tfp pilus assembly protein PilF